MLQVEFPGKQSGTLRFVCRSFIGVNLSSTTWEEAEEAGLGGGRLKLWEYSCISDLSRGSQLLALGTSFMEMSFPLTGCVCVCGGGGFGILVHYIYCVLFIYCHCWSDRRHWSMTQRLGTSGMLLNCSDPSETTLSKHQDFASLYQPVIGCVYPQGERNIGWSSFLWLRELFREMQLWIVSSHLTFPATGRMSASILKVHLSKPDDTGPFIAKISLYPLFCSATFVIDQVTKCVGLVLKSILFYWSLCQSLRQYIQHF